MKLHLEPGAYRRGFNAAKFPPRRRPQCPYTAGSVAGISWNRGAYDRDTGLPPLVGQLATEIGKLFEEMQSQYRDLWRAMGESDRRAVKISQEAYESEERHVRKIAALNGKLREAEDREREAQQQRDFVLDCARLLERAHERGDDVEIDHLIAKLKAGW